MTQTEVRSQERLSETLESDPCGRAFFKSLKKWTFLSRLPAAEFAIGEIVASDWDDEFGVRQVEIGRVVGTCWHPRHQQWEYLVDWLKGCGPSEAYPCFDGHLVEHAPEAPLRRVYAPH